jgi:hypothetical protein
MFLIFIHFSSLPSLSGTVSFDTSICLVFCLLVVQGSDIQASFILNSFLKILFESTYFSKLFNGRVCYYGATQKNTSYYLWHSNTRFMLILLLLQSQGR